MVHGVAHADSGMVKHEHEHFGADLELITLACAFLNRDGEQLCDRELGHRNDDPGTRITRGVGAQMGRASCALALSGGSLSVDLRGIFSCQKRTSVFLF